MDSFPGELILIPPADGDKLVPCLFMPFRHARFIFICFHGNAEDLGRTYEFWQTMRDIFQVHILAVEYPGYGICAGPCSESGIMSNADAAMQFVRQSLDWPLDGIKLFGRSLGTAPTIALAAKCKVAGVVLVTPFLSIREIFRSQVGKVADVFQDYFLNYKLVHQIHSQTLIIHGKNDKLIPCSHGMQIYSGVRGKKMMVLSEKMHHNMSLMEDMQTFVRPMMQFFSLPDYTFIDPELPEWVWPASIAELKLGKEPPEVERTMTWPECNIYRSTSDHPAKSLNLDPADLRGDACGYTSPRIEMEACKNPQCSPSAGDTVEVA